MSSNSIRLIMGLGRGLSRCFVSNNQIYGCLKKFQIMHMCPPSCLMSNLIKKSVLYEVVLTPTAFCFSFIKGTFLDGSDFAWPLARSLRGIFAEPMSLKGSHSKLTLGQAIIGSVGFQNNHSSWRKIFCACGDVLDEDHWHFSTSPFYSLTYADKTPWCWWQKICFLKQTYVK